MALASSAIAMFPPASRSAMMPDPTTAASNSAVPSASHRVERATSGLRRCSSRRLAADRIEPALQREPVEGAERQAGEQLYAVLQRREGLAKGAATLDLRAFDRGRVGQPPMSGHRLARPRRARFARGAVANGEDEVHDGCAGGCEFIPGLRSQAL